MGVFNYAAAGMGAGLGQGLAAFGAQMSRDAEADERFRQQQLLLQQRDADSMSRVQARLDAQAARGASGGRAQGQSVFDLAGKSDDELRFGMSLGGGMDPREADQAIAAARGRSGALSSQVELDPERFDNPDRQDAARAGQQSVSVPKSPAETKALMNSARMALRRALAAPGQTDDVAKAEASERTGQYVDDYAEGNDRSGKAALLSLGKDPDAAQVKADATVEAAQVRGKATTDAASIRAAQKALGGGGGSGVKVRSTYVDGDGNRVAVLSDGSTSVLGSDSSFQKLVQNEKKNLGKSMENIGASDADLERKAADNVRARGAAKAPAGGIAQPKSKAEYDALPRGTRYVKDGKTYVKG
jgi:hypothetical protein